MGWHRHDGPLGVVAFMLGAEEKARIFRNLERKQMTICLYGSPISTSTANVAVGLSEGIEYAFVDALARNMTPECGSAVMNGPERIAASCPNSSALLLSSSKLVARTRLAFDLRGEGDHETTGEERAEEDCAHGAALQ